VLIEAVIVQVSLGNNKDIGISYLQRPQTSGNWTGVGAINNTKGFLGPNDFLHPEESEARTARLAVDSVTWPGSTMTWISS
jgi:type II secretory pathway component GspD/PulD (secretin)